MLRVLPWFQVVILKELKHSDGNFDEPQRIELNSVRERHTRTHSHTHTHTHAHTHACTHTHTHSHKSTILRMHATHAHQPFYKCSYTK